MALLAGTFVLSAIVLVVIVGGMVYLNSTYSRIREEQQEIQDMIRNRAEMLEAYEARQSARYAELDQRLRALEKEE